METIKWIFKIGFSILLAIAFYFVFTEVIELWVYDNTKERIIGITICVVLLLLILTLLLG